MLYSGKKNCTLRHKKNKYSNSRVVRTFFSDESKKHTPPFELNGWSLQKILGRQTRVVLLTRYNF